VRAEPLAFHATHGEAAPIGSLNAERVENGKRVPSEPLHGIGALGHPRSAVAAAVETHEPEMARESRDLAVPHMQVGAERIGKHKDGGALRTLHLHMDGTAIGADLGHEWLLADVSAE
jgi:hypothetical protein